MRTAMLGCFGLAAAVLIGDSLAVSRGGSLVVAGPSVEGFVATLVLVAAGVVFLYLHSNKERGGRS